MNTLLLITFLIFLIATVSCNNSDSPWVKSEPISDSELLAKRGDCFVFRDSTGQYFIGTILTFNKSERGIWYAVCFTNYYDSLLPNIKNIDTLKLDARKVHNGGGYSEFTMGFYVTWARDTLIERHLNFLLGNPEIKKIEKWEIYGEESVSTYSDFLYSYNIYKNTRLFTHLPNKDLIDTSFHPDTLLSFKEAIDAEKYNERLKSNR